VALVFAYVHKLAALEEKKVLSESE